MFKLVFLFATLAGVGAAEVHTNQTFDTKAACEASVSEHTAYVDGAVKVTYHCVEVN